MTECLVTVCGHPDPSKRNRFLLNNVPYDVDGVISTSSLPRQILQRLLVSRSDSALVIMIGATERAIANAILNGFCDEHLKAPKESFCRISLIIGDGVGSDAIQYDCERASDVEAISSENDTAKVLSATVTSTTATPESFQFVENRLTLLFCAPESCDELPKIVDTISHQLRIVPRLIMCHVQSPDEKTLQGCLRFRSQCPSESFGVNEVVSLNSRLRDVRSWSVKVNDFMRLTAAAGPTLIHLNPTSCCDKLAHTITSGCSFVVGSSDDANAFDLVLSPGGELDSVWSPHCRLRNEEGQVFIRPECGLTYVNGVLLAEEVLLEMNDRIAIGTEVILRFANITKARDPALQRIVDWTSKAVNEFVDQGQSHAHALEVNSDKPASGTAFLVLTNPPESNNLSNVWSLDVLEDGVAVNIGTGLDISAPIKGRATLLRDDEGYSVTIGATSKRIHHGSRFLVGESLFLLNDTNRKKSGGERLVTASEAAPLPFSVAPSLLVDLRNDLFDLQWTVSMLFDFAFPIDTTEVADVHITRRKALSDDSVVTSDRFSPSNLTNTLRGLTEALRLIGSQLSSESFSNEGDVNYSLLRALHERNRTIEQLLLGTDSSAPVAWRQLATLQQSLGEKLIRLASSEARGNDNKSIVVESTEGTKKESSPDGMLSLKALITIPTPSVARRLASTVETMARSVNVRQLWDRYCRDLDGLIENSGGAHNVQSSKQQSVLLAMLDVILAFETGVKQGWVVQGDRTYVDRRIATWRIAAEQCCVAFAKPIPSINRKPTPTLTKPRLASPVSSRQPSPIPSPSSRGASRERMTTSTRGARTVSPLQRVPQSINVSPAAVRSGISNKAPMLPLTARSSTSRTSAQSPTGDKNGYSIFQRQGLEIAKKSSRPTSPSATVRPVRTLSPKTLLTKQLLEMEVGNYKRRI